MNDNLIVSVSPHYHKANATTQRVMLDVLIALCPALIAGWVIFGIRTLVLVAFSAANCVFLESVWNRLMKRRTPSPTCPRCSPACSLPSTCPWACLCGS